MDFEQYHEPAHDLPQGAARTMDLEFLLRRDPMWGEIAPGTLFNEGSIVVHSEEGEAR